MKERLDILLVEEGFFDTVEKAKRAIMAGNVIINEKKIDKCGTIIKVNDDLNIRVKGHTCPYVSRGGYKLEKAIKSFNMDFNNKTVLDVGSSTGGFTDCALQNGANYVYAVDVGTNQLDYKLRNNIKVKSIENMHIKDLKKEDVDMSKIDIIVMDVSFISITKIIPDLIKFFNEDTVLMALIKPQFEVEKTEIAKKKHRKHRSRHPNFNDNMGVRGYPGKNSTFNNSYGVEVNEKQTIRRYFDAIDSKMDGYVNFYDFANLMQLSQIFITLDDVMIILIIMT